jgi:EAL domain-containing protein (putative c-di-GMP-specific phosphodiesterase class I)
MGRTGRIALIAAASTIALAGASQAQSAGPAAGAFTAATWAALGLAAVSLLVAILALRAARRAQSDFTRFTRSIEMALRELSTRSERDAASIGELNRRIADEIRALTEAPAAPAQQPAPAPAVAALPAREQAEPAAPVRLAAERQVEAEPSPEAAQHALARVLASGEAEVSLQPIISVSNSAAAGFEVHMHVETGEGGRALDIRRLAQPVPGVDAAAFEVALVRAAVTAGRRQLGTASERMPFHVAVSEALLANRVEVRAIAELAAVHKPLAASLVFSVPAGLATAGGDVGAGIEALSAAGFRFAAENWDGTDAAALRQRGVAFVKLGANRLLDRERSRRRMATGAELAAAAQEAGLAVVGTAVNRDEDAVGLIDLGIDLMVGDRFSGPKRVRSAAARQAALTGT